MTLIEWSAMLAGYLERHGTALPGAQPLNGKELETLMQRFPDRSA